MAGVTGQRDRFQHALQAFALGVLKLFEFLQVGKVRRRGARQFLGALEALLQPLGAVFQRSPHGVSAGGKAPLVQRHQEADGAGARVVALRRGAGTLPFHEAGDLLIQIELGAVDGEGGGVRNSFGEHRLGGPRPIRLAFREVNHRLLGAAQVEGRALPFHGGTDRPHVGVGVAVEQLQKQREVLRVALVGRGGQEQEVVGAVAQQLAQGVTLALVGLVARRHAVRLVNDDQVPMHLPQPGQDVGALGEVERSDDLSVRHPLVDAELVAKVATLEDKEGFVELFLELALPLEGQVGRTDHENPFDEAAQLELADEQAGHDGLTGAGVVGQQETYAGQLEEVFVDGFQLVRQRIDARDGKPEIGVELVGNAERIRLQADSQETSITIVRECGIGNGQVRDVVRAEHHATELLGVLTDEAGLPTARSAGAYGFHPHRLIEQRAAQNLAFSDGHPGSHGRLDFTLPG